jgi:rubrerythrin
VTCERVEMLESAVRDAYNLAMSIKAIANRNGKSTNWEAVGLRAAKAAKSYRDAIAGAKEGAVATVEWAEGSDGEWTCSGCGRDWYIEAETPEANEYLHCPGCGKPIATYKPYSFDDDDDAAAKEETP